MFSYYFKLNECRKRFQADHDSRCILRKHVLFALKCISFPYFENDLYKLELGLVDKK